MILSILPLLPAYAEHGMAAGLHERRWTGGDRLARSCPAEDGTNRGAGSPHQRAARADHCDLAPAQYRTFPVGVRRRCHRRAAAGVPLGPNCEAGAVMMRWVILWTMGCLALIGLPARADAPALVPEKTIPLHSVSGRIDHMAFDRSRNRLMVAELGNNSVEVV